jgi:hypothetical protein
MKFESPDGSIFTLTVDRYEFPDEELGPTEDNPAEDFQTCRFLVVSHRFRNSQGEWRAAGPTMTTTELQRLMDWLDSVQRRQPTANGVYFTERDLEFSVNPDVSVLSVHAYGDFLPAWAERKTTLKIAFPVSEIQFGEVLESLRSQLRAFPGRPPV